MEMRVADYIAGSLAKIGVRNVFMLQGGMVMHLVDAVGRMPAMKYYCNHHEQASAMAADAYARCSGRLGVCYATSGPGATNIVTGLVGAWLESSPVIFFTGQSKLSQTIRGSGLKGLRQFGTFEVDIVPIVESVTKYAVFLDDPKSVRYHLEKAVRLALGGRPGPVLLDIPLDIQAAMINPDKQLGCEDELEPTPVASDENIRSVIEEFQSAKRPLIMCGYGVRVANAVAEFRNLIRKLNCPVVVTQLAKDCLTYDDPLFVGHPGVRGDRAGNFAVQNADMILIIGSSLNAQTSGYEPELFAPHARKIHVDLDKAILRRGETMVSFSIHSEVKAFIERLSQVLDRRRTLWDWVSWQKQCVKWKHHYSVIKEPHRLGGDNDLLNYYEFVNVLSEMLCGDETIVADAGSSFYVMGQGFKLKDGQRFISSGALGSMGFSLPASLGAAVARPEQATICVTGDGSLQTNVHELQTVRHYNLNIKAFIILNDGYVSMRNTQDSYFDGFRVGSSQESGVSFPCLEDLANTYKLPYVDCASRSQLNTAVRNTIDMPGPVICGIHAQPDQVIMPGVGSIRLPNGRMQSSPLHEMKPLLNETELQKNMYW
jgi:acetolactate synthase-1/2/3 large subunit